MALAIAASLVISGVVAAGIFAVGIPWLGSRYAAEPVGAVSQTSTSTEGGNAPAPAPAPSVPSAVPAGLTAAPVLYRVSSSIGNEPLSDGAVIRTGDQLSLTVEAGVDPVVCYVLDEDASGIDYVLFPLPGYRLRNPLAPGASHQLPDAGGSRGRTWAVDSENGREDVVVVTSVVPLPWLERMIRDIPRASGDAAAPETASLPAPSGLVTRGMGRTAPPPPTGRLAAVLDRLRSSQEFQSGRAGLWRIRLESPSSTR
jgi:hypothetical protein